MRATLLTPADTRNSERATLLDKVAQLRHSAAMSKPALLSTRDVAQRLRVSVPTVTRLAREGGLEPAMKLDGPRGAYLFHPDVVEALAASRALEEAPA